MRFVFRHVAQGAGQPLPIIPEIPDIRLAQLEGRNGIGKTMAARLLELVAGQQPFAALPKAWASLVELLGTVEIEATGASEGPIVLTLNSADWKNRTQADCATNPGSAKIAGRAATWDEVRRLFQVRRIAGDEGLAETLGRTLREQSIAAEVEATRLVPVVAGWSEDLSALRDVSTVASPSDLEALRAAEKAASKRYEAAQDSARSAAEAAALLEEELLTAKQTRMAVRAIPSLLAVYEAKLAEHETARARIAVLEGQLAAAGAAQVRGAETRKEIGVWTRRLDLRRTALTRARLQERQLLSFLGLAAAPPPTELDALQENAADELSGLKARLRTVDMASTVRNVGTDIEVSLNTIPLSGRDEAIAELDRPVSAAELLVGIRTRRDALRDVPRPGEAVDLEREIRQAELRSRRLRELPALLETTARKLANVREAEERLSTLLSLTGDQRTARGVIEEELAAQREVLVSASSEAVQALASIQALGAVESAGEGADGDAQELVESSAEETAENDDAAFEAAEEALESAVRQILRPAADVREQVATWFQSAVAELHAEGVNELTWGADEANERALSDAIGELSDASARADEQLGSAVKHRDDHERVRDAARATLRAERVGIAAAFTALLDPDGRWGPYAPTVRQVAHSAHLTDTSLALTPEGFLGGTATGAEQAAIEVAASTALEVVARVAEEIEEAATKWRDGWGTVSAFLQRETHRLAPRLADERPWSLGGLDPSAEGVLRTWTEQAIGSILSSESLRNELFDETDQVAFDLFDLAVSWRDKEGRRRRRPLEAFSSGEQVFAYTRAKLETFRALRHSTGLVVIFLDEFGAFVARDRFSELLRYVQEEALGTIADQVVVMLPLSSSNVEQALASRTLRPADEEGALVRDGYFVVSAEPERVR